MSFQSRKLGHHEDIVQYHGCGGGVRYFYNVFISCLAYQLTMLLTSHILTVFPGYIDAIYTVGSISLCCNRPTLAGCSDTVICSNSAALKLVQA